MTREEKEWIDAATYREMLQKSRYDAVENAFFKRADTSQYFQAMLWQKRQVLSQEEAMAINQEVGWPDLCRNRKNSML